jgi:hypothetical protein
MFEIFPVPELVEGEMFEMFPNPEPAVPEKLVEGSKG